MKVKDFIELLAMKLQFYRIGIINNIYNITVCVVWQRPYYPNNSFIKLWLLKSHRLDIYTFRLDFTWFVSDFLYKLCTAEDISRSIISQKT